MSQIYSIESPIDTAQAQVVELTHTRHARINTVCLPMLFRCQCPMLWCLSMPYAFQNPCNTALKRVKRIAQTSPY